MAKNDKKREMVEKTRSQREIMRAIILEARKVLPTLAAIAKKSEFELTISNDKHGFTLTCYTGEPLNLDGEAPANPIEIETIEIPNEVRVEEEQEPIQPLTAEDIAEIKLMEEEDSKRITKALEKANWNFDKAAQLLGLSDRTLHRKIAQYKITKPQNK